MTLIAAEDWLAHPGSVGKSMTGAIHIVDDDGEELAGRRGGRGVVRDGSPFEYHNDPDKTEAYDERGLDWLGDVGSGRRRRATSSSPTGPGHMIISGGVNIYPREIEDVLVVHPAVADVGRPRRAERRHRRAGQGLRPAGRRGAPSPSRRPSSSRGAASASATSRCRGRSTSSTSSRASPPARSRSACCASRTGRAARRASCRLTLR